MSLCVFFLCLAHSALLGDSSRRLMSCRIDPRGAGFTAGFGVRSAADGKRVVSQGGPTDD